MHVKFRTDVQITKLEAAGLVTGLQSYISVKKLYFVTSWELLSERRRSPRFRLNITYNVKAAQNNHVFITPIRFFILSYIDINYPFN